MLLLPATSSAWAQDPAASPSPSPKELWEAYPLEPGQAPATATPSAEMGAGAKATPSPASSASAGDDGAGMPWHVVILLAAPLVFAGGLLLGHRRNRDKAEPAVTVAEPPAPKRFQWRDYPEPARPAPPPPPVPGSRAPGFEVGLEEERSAGPARTKQREPH